MATGLPHYRRITAGAGRGLPGLVPALHPALHPASGAGGADQEPSGFAVGGGGPGVGRPAPAGFDTVTVPVRHGLETVDILRLRRACGTVHQTGGGSAIAFLVPAGVAGQWHLPGTSCTPGAKQLPATDPRWVMPPAGPTAAARATDPWVLRSALCEAACTLTASGLGPF
ncbi:MULTISPECIES: hypothetical protein [unclassified Kitasatospora]|uniref:hypothetical protein n=1 Tax=unclassified Kitasatospora TaxID=2633591 RepID=UPI0007109EA3|nr:MULTISPECIES: hypothetical protein [unclassified Kitasatospora]KQV11788.1 hypothetical protein ASC99_10160 [Kitasatospora sp. Root107]KRB76630.1 hypothetical protein ASE03_13235 [Kitasatospora sp. Root187]